MLEPSQIGYKAHGVRHPVMIPARMRMGSSWIGVVIHNLSCDGALLAADEAPDRGTYVEICRGRQIIIGRVVWQKDCYFGIKSRDKIDITNIINEPRLAARPQSQDHPEASFERRANPRFESDARITSRLENSRRWSAAFQFGVFLVLALIAAGFVATEVYNVLSRPFLEVKSHL